MMTLRRFVTASVLGLSLGTAPYLLSQNGVSIGGRVYDADSNAPLSGVRISSVWIPVGSAAPVAVLARSQDDGSFALTVAPGSRVVCVDAGKAYLDPCQWSPGTTTIDTARSSRLDLPLRRGVLLIVRLHDPTGAGQAALNATPALAKVPAPLVAVTAVDASGASRPIPFVASSGANSEFSLLVPPSTTFRLGVASSTLQLADVSGNPLAQNAFSTSLVVPTASEGPPPSPLGRPLGSHIPSRIFNFVVTGRVSP